MQPISRIKLRLEPTPITRIPGHGIKVHHNIIRPALTNPLINPLPRLLPITARIPGSKRGDGRPKRLESRLLRITRNLRKRRDQLIPRLLLGAGIGGSGADVINAFEDHDIFRARTLERVAGIPGDEGGSETVVEDPVPAGGLVVHRDVEAGGAEAGDQKVRPAVVRVISARAAVGDGVAEDVECAGGLGRPGFDAGEEVPVHSAPAVDIGGVDMIPLLHPGSSPAAGVAGDDLALLPVLEVQGHGDVGFWLDDEVDWVGVGDSTGGDGNAGGAGEGETAETGGLDLADASGAVEGEGKGGRGDGEGSGTEDVGDLEADAGGADGDVEGLAEGRILELRSTGLVC